MTPEELWQAAQQEFFQLRRWARDHLHAGHPIRQQHYQMALSTVVHRLLKFGPDGILNTYSARDLMNLLIYVNGECAEWVMRTAFTRALIEDDKEIIDRLMSLEFGLPEQRLWYWQLVDMLIAGQGKKTEMETLILAMPAGERCVARLLQCRLFPDTARADWLTEIPDDPSLASHLCASMAQRRELHGIIDKYLREHPIAKSMLVCI